MQKIYSLLIFLSIISYGQQGRVGINTDSPEATLDIKEKPLDEMPEGYSQGVSFPNFTTKERKTFTEVKLGTMIYNTTKNRLEIYTVVNGKEGWYSIGVVEEEPLSTKTISAADIAQKQKIMFQDDEPESVLFDGNQRGFHLNAMIQVSKIDKNKFRIRNFLPRKFNDVEIYFKNANTAAPVKILVLEELAALSEVEIDLPFDGGSLRFEDADGNAESYAASDLKTDNYTLSVDVPDNFLFQRMKTIKHKTFISFGKYGSGNYQSAYRESLKYDYTDYKLRFGTNLTAINMYSLDKPNLPVAVFNTKINDDTTDLKDTASPTIKSLFRSITAHIDLYNGDNPNGRGRVMVGSANGPSAYPLKVPRFTDGFRDPIERYTNGDIEYGEVPLVYNRRYNVLMPPTNVKTNFSLNIPKFNNRNDNFSDIKRYLIDSIKISIKNRCRCMVDFIPSYINLDLSYSKVIEKILTSDTTVEKIADILINDTPLCENYNANYRELGRYNFEPQYYNTDYNPDIDRKYGTFINSNANKAVNNMHFMSYIISQFKTLGLTKFESSEPLNEEDIRNIVVDIFGRSNLNVVKSSVYATPHDYYSIDISDIDSTSNISNLMKYINPSNSSKLLIKSPFLRLNHTYYTHSVTEMGRLDSDDSRTPEWPDIYGTMNDYICGCIVGGKVRRATGDIDLDKYRGKLLTFKIGRGGSLFFNLSSREMSVGGFHIERLREYLNLDNNGMAIVKMELEDSLNSNINLNLKDIFVSPNRGFSAKHSINELMEFQNMGGNI